MDEAREWIGIDVAKDTLEVASSAELATQRWSNEEGGITALVAALGPARRT